MIAKRRMEPERGFACYENDMRRLCVCAVFLSMACKSEPAASPSAAPPSEPSASSEGLPVGNEGPTEELTADACTADGGVVVGDIGDGAIFKADYTCENGKAPRARIKADPDGPIGVEGSVCC